MKRDDNKRRKSDKNRDNFFTAESYNMLGRRKKEEVDSGPFDEAPGSRGSKRESQNLPPSPEKVEALDQEVQKASKESFFTNYALKNNFFRSKVFSIGFFSVFITILAFYSILEITNLTSIVFYNLVESESGDSEILLTRDPKTRPVETLFEYDEEAEIESNFRAQVSNNPTQTPQLTLTQSQIDDFLEKARQGDSQAAFLLFQTGNLSLEKGLEILPQLMKGIGLVRPEEIRKSLFEEDYFEGYSSLFEERFKYQSLEDVGENRKKVFLEKYVEMTSTSEMETPDKQSSNKFTYYNPSLDLFLPSMPNLGLEFERSKIKGISGRWILPSNVTNPDPSVNRNPENPDEIYQLQANLIVTDIANEIKSGIGRNSAMKDLFHYLDLDKYERKEDVFENNAVVSSTIGSYLSLDEKISIRLNFDYFLNKLGFDDIKLENLIQVTQFVDFFGQIKFGKNEEKFYLDSSKKVETPSVLSFIRLEDVVDFMNQALENGYTLIDQVAQGTESEFLDQLPFPKELITSQLPSRKELTAFIDEFWQNTYSTFLEQIIGLINTNLTELTNLEVDYSIQGELPSSKGLFNSLLGNVVILDRKGLSQRLVDVLEEQVNQFEANFDQILAIDGLPAQFRTSIAEPFVKQNLDYLRDIIKFVFQGNKEGDLFQSQAQSPLFGQNANPFEPLSKSTFEGFLAYFPLTQIYSPNKDLIYENLNEFEELSDDFSNDIAAHLENQFSYMYTNPLKITLLFMQNLHIFIKVLLINIVIILGIINVIIIYSLTSLAVNEKNFEFGIIRALGLPKAGLLKLIGKK